MSRPIDADRLKVVLEKNFGHTGGASVLAQLIDEQPTIDAPSVVRCRDCKWYEIRHLKADGTDDRRFKPNFCVLYDRCFLGDHFCADGERRENGKA